MIRRAAHSRSPKKQPGRRRRRVRLRRWVWSHLQGLVIAPAFFLVPRLSRSMVWRLGARLGALAYGFDRRGRRIARANLQLVYGRRLSPQRSQALIRVAYRHAARVLLDMFWFGRRRQSRIRRWCTIEPETWRQLASPPVILATAHLGNWEIAGQTLAASGIALTSVAKPIGSARTTGLLNRSREATGQEIVFASGAVRALMRAVRRRRLVALVQDQHTDPQDGGVYVAFMGLPAAVSSTAAVLSRRMAVPVVTGACLSDARGRYRCRVNARLEADADESVEALTGRISDSLSKLIRRHPGQWLWMYKRWKRIPSGADPSRYPFYARPEEA